MMLSCSVSLLPSETEVFASLDQGVVSKYIRKDERRVLKQNDHGYGAFLIQLTFNVLTKTSPMPSSRPASFERTGLHAGAPKWVLRSRDSWEQKKKKEGMRSHDL